MFARNQDDDSSKKLTISTLKSAVQEGRTELIRNSLRKYGLPQSENRITDYSVLKIAVKNNKTEIATLLINAGCRLNRNKNEATLTPLALAIQSENEDIASLLLQKKAKYIDIGMRNNKIGFTVLHLAAELGSLKMLNFLLAQLKISIDHVSKSETPFQVFLENCSKIYEKKNIDIVKLFLANEASIDFKTSDGQTVLHHVAKTKCNDIIKDVLQATDDLNKLDDYKNTALHYLLYESNPSDENVVEIVKWFLAKGANVDIQNYSGDTPCHLAAENKCLHVLKILLHHQLSVNCQNIRGNTVLHCLCKYKVGTTNIEDLHMAEIVEICINKGAAVDLKDNESKTPLYWAVLLRQKHMVKTYLHFNADPNVLDDQGGTILENLMKQIAGVRKKVAHEYEFSYPGIIEIPQDIKRDTEIAQLLLSRNPVAEIISTGQVSIFHYCAANSHIDMLYQIIPYSRDPNIQDSNQNRIIHTLLTRNLYKTQEVKKKILDIIAILLSKGAKIEAKNNKGETALHLAAKGKYFEISKVLIEHKAKVSDLDNSGNTVLHFLCMLQFETEDPVEQNLSELFLSKGCDINARNRKGMTPFLVAAQSGSISMIIILIKLNANFDCVENDNLSTAIHLAAENNHQEVIQQLINLGMDVNIRRDDGKTALHLSVTHNLPKATKVLLGNGADTDLKDKDGKTPLHLACKDDNLCNNEVLLKYCADVNVEDNYSNTPIMLTQLSSDTCTKLIYHVIRLKVAKMPLSDPNKSYIDKHIEEYRSNSYKAIISVSEMAALEEISRMEKISIAPRTSLADVLRMSASKLSFFINNEDLQNLLSSNDFKKKFPIYAIFVRACYRKGIIRSELMISAKEAFREILELALPDICCDVIFDYLDNEDLHNLDEAAKIRMAKRKRELDDIKSKNEDPVSKRVRKASI